MCVVGDCIGVLVCWLWMCWVCVMVCGCVFCDW